MAKSDETDKVTVSLCVVLLNVRMIAVFLDYLSDNHSDYHSDSIQQFSLLEKLSESNKSYMMSSKIYSKCRNLELTLPVAMCQFIGRLNKGDNND